ncbi:MAG TPA: hypothetical protein H9900_03030 [Candidatus Monoglobus merdigallinarum]|uniref:Uncharacterized protein n=1 Tax=Candidatus Monoglobus merdigallinarum TaxID=2838698 RepID=A0A9D1PR98_9FIRM|nr:hypothetical protein [Candidatus Monoglobus merdigallinarum]
MTVKFDINKINIEAETAPGGFVSLRHEFVIKTSVRKPDSSRLYDAELYFSLPEGSSITGFEVKGGGFSGRSIISEHRYHVYGPHVSVVQTGRDNYLLGFRGVPALSANFSVIISSVAFMDSYKDGWILKVPLYTKSKFDYADETEAEVSISVCAELKHGGSLASTSHMCEVKNNGNYTELRTDIDSRRFFEFKVSGKETGENVGYICPKSPRGYVCLYNITPPSFNQNDYVRDVVYLLDSENFSDGAVGGIAGIFAEVQDNRSSLMVFTSAGESYSEEFITPVYKNVKELREWLESGSRADGRLSAEVFNRAVAAAAEKHAAIVCITDRGALIDQQDIFPEDLDNFNIVNIGEPIYDDGLRQIAESCGGHFCHIIPGFTDSRRIEVFLSMVCGRSLENLKISEAAAGAFYKTPFILKKYTSQKPITLAIATETEYPEEFYLSADGGYEETVLIDRFEEVGSSTNIHKAFGGMVIGQIYDMIRSGDLDESSVIKLKSIASKVSLEYGVLSPDNSCFMQFETSGGREYDRTPIKLSLRYNYDKGIRGKLLTLEDSVPSRSRTAEMIRQTLAVLMCCVRSDGSITTPYESSDYAAAAQTANAAFALNYLMRKQKNSEYGDYSEIIRRAREYLKRSDFSEDDFYILTSPGKLPLHTERAVDVRKFSALLIDLTKSGMC